MDIAELLKPDGIVLELEVENKADLLTELAARASRATGVTGDSILKLLSAREACGSTGIGQGIAIPHASVGGLRETFGIFARLATPIDFDSIDAEPVDLVFLLLTPAGTPNQNIAALAAISRRLRDRRILRGLRTGKSPEELHSQLAGPAP